MERDAKRAKQKSPDKPPKTGLLVACSEVDRWLQVVQPPAPQFYSRDSSIIWAVDPRKGTRFRCRAEKDVRRVTHGKVDHGGGCVVLHCSFPTRHYPFRPSPEKERRQLTTTINLAQPLRKVRVKLLAGWSDAISSKTPTRRLCGFSKHRWKRTFRVAFLGFFQALHPRSGLCVPV